MRTLVEIMNRINESSRVVKKCILEAKFTDKSKAINFDH